MDYKNLIENKTILITGGTGSFGTAAVERLLTYHPKRIIVFSRDEKKQFDMGNRFDSEALRFIIGDVRDRDSVSRAMQGVNLVFHAAALKQVPSCEFFPMEAVRTNVLGTHHVISAAVEHGVERIVVLSTDKAVNPINVMGTTKALAEKIMIAAAREKRSRTVLCGTRYGNVMLTRGSVIPHFLNLMKQGKPLTLTDGKMTRFMMPLEDSLELILFALTNGKDGEIYVKKAPAATIRDLAEALVSLFDYDKGIKEMGVRPGEKIHEILVAREELQRTDDLGEYFRIQPESPEMDYRNYYFRGGGGNSLPEEGYTSANTRRLSIEETKTLLRSLDEFRKLAHVA